MELKSAVVALRKVSPFTGPMLKDVRKTLGLKQAELAEVLGVADESISRWETESRPMEPWVRLALLALVYNALEEEKS